MSRILELDTALFVFLNQTFTSDLMDVVMPFLTDFDHWRIPIILILLVVTARGGKDVRIGVLFAILAVVVADQISSAGIKQLVERERPFKVIEGTRQLVGAYGYAFPSSHAANTFAAGTFIALRFPRVAWLLVIPFLVGYSRVYVGVHYPLDVLGGAVLGAAVGFGFVVIERASRVRIDGLLERLPQRKKKDPSE